MYDLGDGLKDQKILGWFGKVDTASNLGVSWSGLNISHLE